VPVPASDAIASDVGHGALGLRDNLRPLSELLGETSGQRHVWVELRLAKLITGWAFAGSGTYVAGVSLASWDGAAREVMGVKTAAETLTRVETLAACLAQDGTFYVAIDAPLTIWDGGLTTWDSGATTWDQPPLLYVHLTNGANAAETDIVAQFGLFVGTHGVWQPMLGQDKLTDGGLEAWASATDLTSWTEAAVGAGGGVVNRDSTIVRQGTYSCRIDGSLNAAGGRAISQASLTGVGGAHYRASGYYQTDPANPAGVAAALRVGLSGSYLLADGLNTTAAATGVALANTAGEWRRFVFDFRCPSDTAALELAWLAYNSTGGALSGTVRFDALRLQRIYRFELAEPLLTLDGVPTLDAARQDAFFGPVGVALGQLAIANGGGRFEPLLASFDWTNQEAIIRLGGRFPNGGNEVLFDDCGVQAVGLMADPAVSDSRVSVQLEDARQRLRPSIPTRYYTLAEFGNLADADKGRVRPLVLGTVLGIRPARIGINSSGYGTYEVADVSDSPAGMKRWGVNARFFTHLYTDEDAARKHDTNAELQISYSPGEILGDEITGRFEVLQDVRVVRLSYENNVIDFDIGGSALKATQTPGIWTLQGWGDFIVEDQMNAVAGVSDISISYDVATNKFTISKGAGTLNLRCATGANRGNSMYGVLGFSSAVDRTGSLSYLGDSAVSEGVEQHVIRVDAKGFIDDASGTYTGTPSALIEKAPDVALYLLNRHLGVPLSSIDLPSLVAARAAHPAPLSVYLGALSNGTGGSSVSAFEMLEKIENGAGADISLEGDVWRWRTRDASVPADVVDLFEYDLLSWEAGYNAQDCYSVVRVAYGQDPTSGADIVTQQTRSEVGVRFGRPDQRTFPTYLASAGDAEARLAAFSAEAATKRARFRFRAKGKLLLTAVGAKVRLTRSKGLDETGALSGVLARILRKNDDVGAWASDVEAIEVV
jgi:hypothetical protein